jgi:hypothetical protein
VSPPDGVRARRRVVGGVAAGAAPSRASPPDALHAAAEQRAHSQRLRARSADAAPAAGDSPPRMLLLGQQRGPSPAAAAPPPPWRPALGAGSSVDGDSASVLGGDGGVAGCAGGDRGSSLLDAVEGAAEVLLEAYLGETEQLLLRARRLRDALADCEGQVNLQLATGRNRLMRVEVGLSTLTLSLTVCTVVSGYLGMNVSSGLERSAGAFTAVVLGTCAAALLVAATIALALRRTLVV